jgi:hypothetical protein
MRLNRRIIPIMEKKKRGRPAKFNTPNKMELKINKYFESLIKPDGTSRPPTTAGLAWFLGFSDRQSLYDNKGRSEDFSCAIKKALLHIESFHEEHLFSNGSTGSIFWLKNHSWQDKQDIKQEIDMGVRAIDTSKLTQAEKDAIAKAAINTMNLDD